MGLCLGPYGGPRGVEVFISEVPLYPENVEMCTKFRWDLPLPTLWYLAHMSVFEDIPTNGKFPKSSPYPQTCTCVPDSVRGSEPFHSEDLTPFHQKDLHPAPHTPHPTP